MNEQTRHAGMTVALALGLGLALGALGTWSLAGAREVTAAGLQQGEAAAPPPGALASNTNVMSSAYEPVDGKGGEEVSGPYQVVKGWPRPVVDGWTINAETMYAESPDRIIAVGRGTRKSPWSTFWGPAAFRNLGKPIPAAEQKQQRMIVVYNRQGTVVESWDQWSPLLVDVQLVQENPYDPEHHIWIATDESLVELTRDGKTHVRTIDVKDIPPAQTQDGNFVVEFFAFSSNGDLWAAGGHRLVRFSSDGKFVSAFGKAGSGPGEFGIVGQGLHGNGIHGVVIDSNRNRMYVVDRVNSRIDVFNLSGKFLDEWPNIVGAYGIRLTADGRYAWVNDGYTQKVMKYDALTGTLVPGSTWGTMGIAPGAIWGFHFFTTDTEGNLYVGEDMAFRIQKFVPRRGGNPVQIIGPLMQ
jgi:DNA-binding beta-propeller fold protein YncE